MLKTITFILSASLVSLSLLSFGLFYGFHYGSLLQGAIYTIGKMALSGPGPYENSIFLQRIISVLSIAAFFSLFSEKNLLSRLFRLSSLFIIILLYIVLNLSKLRYIYNYEDSYFDFMRYTLWFDIAGCVLALAWESLTIYSMLIFQKPENSN